MEWLFWSGKRLILIISYYSPHWVNLICAQVDSAAELHQGAQRGLRWDQGQPKKGEAWKTFCLLVFFLSQPQNSEAWNWHITISNLPQNKKLRPCIDVNYLSMTKRSCCTILDLWTNVFIFCRFWMTTSLFARWRSQWSRSGATSRLTCKAPPLVSLFRKYLQTRIFAELNICKLCRIFAKPLFSSCSFSNICKLEYLPATIFTQQEYSENRIFAKLEYLQSPSSRLALSQIFAN